jgi:hypothetical protein
MGHLLLQRIYNVETVWSHLRILNEMTNLEECPCERYCRRQAAQAHGCLLYCDVTTIQALTFYGKGVTDLVYGLYLLLYSLYADPTNRRT